MNPSIQHRDTERNVKKWLSDQYKTHGTNVPQFTEFDGTDYQKEVSRLAVNIFTYIPDEQKRTYTQTINLDWSCS